LGFSQNKKGATLKEKGFFPTTRLGFSYKASKARDTAMKAIFPKPQDVGGEN